MKVYSSLFIVAILILLLMKVDTNIYVGDYSYFPRHIDIQLRIDNELILDDSLSSSPFFPTILNKRMGYGFHTINVTSKRANVNQENRVFLLPNQYIYVEFLGADTLYLKEDIPLNSNDSVEKDLFFLNKDSMKTIVLEESLFRIESLFNPFYTE